MAGGLAVDVVAFVRYRQWCAFMMAHLCVPRLETESGGDRSVGFGHRTDCDSLSASLESTCSLLPARSHKRSVEAVLLDCPKLSSRNVSFLAQPLSVRVAFAYFTAATS